MGRRGPKGEPAAVKEAKGNPGRRRIVSVPELDSAAVQAPDWLKNEALVIWKRMAPRLISFKLLSVLDASAFARYCKNYSVWVEMQKRFADADYIYEIETASGKVRRADPSFAIAHRLEALLVAAEDRFGLNPAERQKIFAARAAGAGVDPDLFGNVKAPVKGKVSAAPAKAGIHGFLQ